MKKKVGIFVDHPIRDLNGMVLLCISLLKADDVECYLIPMNISNLELEIVNPDYILFPGYRQGAFKKYKEFKERGKVLGFLETEGGFYEYPEVIKNIVCFENPKFPDRVFSWGEVYKKICIENNFVLPDLITVSGNPRFDVPFHISKSALKEEDKYILVNAKFPGVVVRDDDEFESNKSYTSVFDLETQKAMYNKRSEFVLTIKKILNETDYKIKLRPHPFESLSFYKRQFSEFETSRVEILNNEDIYSAIRDSWCVISTNCTTSYDAHVSGVISLNLKYLSLIKDFNLLEGVSLDIASVDELIITLHNIKSGLISKKSSNQFLRVNDSIYNSGGHASVIIAENIIKDLKRIKAPRKGNKIWNIVTGNLKYNIHPTKKVLKSIVRLFKFEVQDFKKYALESRVSEWRKSYKYFDAQTVKERLKYLNIDLNSVIVSRKSFSNSVKLTRLEKIE